MSDGRKRETVARVTSQERIAADIYDLVLETALAADARPGQFVSLYCRDASRILPRPISICDADAAGGTLRLVYRTVGAGTAELSTLRAGDAVRVAGCLGNGYDLAEAAGKRVLCVGGGLGIPPMLFLMKRLRGPQGGDSAVSGTGPISLTAVLGYRNAETFLLRDFEAVGAVALASDDGSVGVKGTVLDAIRAEGLAHDVLFSCGPLPMLRALAGYCGAIPGDEVRNGSSGDADMLHNKCYVSLEERMACGVGACLGCVVRTARIDGHSRVHNARVCAEGPVFDAREVAW